MRCDEFDCEEFSRLLLIRAGSGKRNPHRHAWRDPEIRGLYESTAPSPEQGEQELKEFAERMRMQMGEYYLHHQSCGLCERIFQEYLSGSRYSIKELGLIQKGLEAIAKEME